MLPTKGQQMWDLKTKTFFRATRPNLKLDADFSFFKILKKYRCHINHQIMEIQGYPPQYHASPPENKALLRDYPKKNIMVAW